MKKLISEEEWIVKHKNEIDYVYNLVEELDNDKKIQRLYKKFFKSKDSVKKIAYNIDYISSNNFEKGFSADLKVKIKNEDTVKFGCNSSTMNYG